MVEITPQQQPEVPQQLVELARESKPTSYAEGVVRYYEKDVANALNYDMIRGPTKGPLTLESFLAGVKLEVSTNERLAEAMMASPGSFVKALLLAASCKLVPGQAYGLFYLIPRWNKKLRCNEVTPLIGYRGLTELAQRHPRVHKIEAHLVYEGEEFHFNPGEGKLNHVVNLMADRDASKVIGGYARVVITEPASTHPVLDDPVIHVMNRKEIDAIMHRSDAWKNAESKGWNNSPWHTDWKPMAKKTLLRAVMNGGAVPRDMGVGGAIQADDQADLIPTAKAVLPKQSTQDSIRAELGIDEKPAPPFDVAEEAVEAIKACETVAALDALKPRVQHFQGVDAETVAQAFEDREDLLS